MSFSEQIKNEILNNMQKDLKDKNKVASISVIEKEEAPIAEE